MGTSERKAKEKEEIKTLILNAAKKLFVKIGNEQVTIRKIAEEIEYSVGTVYVYFKDKNDILNELHRQGFGQLGSAIGILKSVSDPMERLKALGRVYFHFALDNPDMYDLMFNMKAPMEFLEAMQKEEWNEGKATFDVLRKNVEKCMESGHFKGHQLEPLSFVIWSTVHGMCSLHISQRVKGVIIENPESIIEKAYEEFVALIDKE
ncbi:TetR/AcrR family transcriptional regulator [Aquiflexum lacus]|uniref:TetR/AcrR family transcriptional regulator n=1 Tax=Aquiflexum lacus TaxID=2483805 RepID=UPI00189467FD|nr:TetR/AcrR family transcriptional regulator [Aquiflexum lacus]